MATYFIDSVGGNDANAGTSKSAPWARAPGMKNGSGVAHTSGFGVVYVPASGDQFIFKGGTTWLASFPWKITWANTTWGTDQTWFSGSSWTRAVFDNEWNTGVTGQVSLNANNITFGDGFDCKKASIPQWYGPGQTSIVNSLGAWSNVRITNAIIRDWKSQGETDPSGTQSGSGGLSASGGVQVLVDHCEFRQDGVAPGYNTNSCMVNVAEAAFNNIHHIGNCFQGGTKLHDNWIHDCLAPPTNLQDHTNAFSLFGNHQIYNNLVYNLEGHNGPINIQSTSTANRHILIYNNVMFSLGGQPAIYTKQESASSSMTIEIYNCTIANNPPIRMAFQVSGPTIGTLISRNNHFITTTPGNDGVAIDSGVTVNTYTHDHNIVQTPSTATSFGYTPSNNYQPTSGSSPTVDAGTTISSVTTDRLGVARPQGSAYDVGAYEWGGAPPPNQPAISVNPSSLDWGSVAI